ncbi:MAG: PQQ-binding-like beta-propeller repeat protein [Ktedonobacteraceae bacterium]
MFPPDPESVAQSETQVEITDLGGPSAFNKVSKKFIQGKRIFSFHRRTWMTLATVVGIVVLGGIVLGNVWYQPKKEPVNDLPHIQYPVSLSVADGVCYATATNGVVTALRIRDGSLLWHHTDAKTNEATATVIDGIVYLVPLYPNDPTATTGTVEALRASDGVPLWFRTLPRDSRTLFHLTVVNNVVYIRSVANTIDAFRTSDGSLLRHYTAQTPIVSMATDGTAFYVLTQDGHLSALRARSGSTIRMSTTLIPPQSSISVVADSMIFITLHDGGMEALQASTGVLLWHSSPSVPALALSPQPFVINDIVYTLTQDGHLFALRTSSGSTMWHSTLSMRDGPPSLFALGDVIYIEMADGSVDAVSARSGSILWHHQGGAEGTWVLLTATESVVYLASIAGMNELGSITALRASDGKSLWHSTPSTHATQVIPAVAESLVLLPLQDGSINALRTENGSLRWHHTMDN